MGTEKEATYHLGPCPGLRSRSGREDAGEEKAERDLQAWEAAGGRAQPGLRRYPEARGAHLPSSGTARPLLQPHPETPASPALGLTASPRVPVRERAVSSPTTLRAEERPWEPSSGAGERPPLGEAWGPAGLRSPAPSRMRLQGAGAVRAARRATTLHTRSHHPAWVRGAWGPMGSKARTQHRVEGPAARSPGGGALLLRPLILGFRRAPFCPRKRALATLCPPLAGTLGSGHRKFLDDPEPVCHDRWIRGSKGLGGDGQGHVVGSGPASCVPSPPSPRPISPPASAPPPPIALSVFIDLGETGEGWGATTQAAPLTVSEAQNSTQQGQPLGPLGF